MTAGETAEVAAEYAAPWIERLARVGFAAKALLYTTVGVLAARMAMGDGGLQSLYALGKWPFVSIAVGLVAYGMYELLNARYRRIRVLAAPDRARS